MDPGAIVAVSMFPLAVFFVGARFLLREANRHKAEMAEIEVRRIEAQTALLRASDEVPRLVDRGDPSAVDAWHAAKREVDKMGRIL